MAVSCQLRSRISGHIRGINVRVGTIYWASTDDARHDIDNRLGELIVDEPAAPAATATPTPAPAAPPAPVVEIPEKKEILVRNQGYPVDRFSRVERAWEGDTVVCIASGPSLTADQINRTRAKVDRDGGRVWVAVINTTYEKVPWADLLYFADSKWWNWHKDKPAYKTFAGIKCTIWASGNSISDPAVHMLRQAEPPRQGMSNDPGALVTGSNSGHMLLNLVGLSAPRRILLLAYDAKEGRGGKKHHHADHPDQSLAPYQQMLAFMPKLASDLKAMSIEVVNCSTDTALECFQKGKLEDYLPDPMA